MFKGIPVQSMLEMPPLPIKSEMSSTSAAAAESADWSSLLSVYSHRHSFQWKDIIVQCAAYINWGKETLSIISPFYLVLCPPASFLLLFLASPSASFHHSSTSACCCLSFCLVLRSEITADCREPRGWRQCAGWLIFKTHTHTHTHTNTPQLLFLSRRAATMSGVEMR